MCGLLQRVIVIARPDCSQLLKKAGFPAFPRVKKRGFSKGFQFLAENAHSLCASCRKPGRIFLHGAVGDGLHRGGLHHAP
jgi:hypothetical protein